MSAVPDEMPDAARAERCPRCGARLGTAAAAALADQRRARAAGAPVAVPESPAFCGCCGLLIATGA